MQCHDSCGPGPPVAKSSTHKADHHKTNVFGH